MVGEGNASIVIVDDNPDNLQVLSAILKAEGYKVRPALSGKIALRAIETSPPDLILLDIMMPDMNGYEACKMLKANSATRDIPVIFISALSELGDRLSAFRAGAVDYLSKPFQAVEVLARVKVHLRLRLLEKGLKAQVDEKTSELQAAFDALQASEKAYHLMLQQSVEAIALAVEKRDPYTSGHQLRVAHLSEAIAKELGLAEGRREGVRMGAMIHDVGKIAVPAEILNRPGRLSAVEFALIKTHAETGFEIVRHISFPWPVAQMVLQHHERFDGSGYPQGLQGEEIIEEARILAVADVVEAITNHRPYRPALGVEYALESISKDSGRFYDPDVINACLRVFSNPDFKLPAAFSSE